MQTKKTGVTMHKEKLSTKDISAAWQMLMYCMISQSLVYFFVRISKSAFCVVDLRQIELKVCVNQTSNSL